MLAEGLGLGLAVGAVGVDPLRGIGHRPLSGLALLDGPGCFSLGLLRGIVRGAGGPRHLGGRLRGVGGLRRPHPRLVERGAGGTGAGHADAPARGPEPVARPGDDDAARLGERHVDGLDPRVGDRHGTDEHVEQTGHVGPVGPDVLAHRPHGGRGSGGRGRAEREHRAAQVVVAQVCERGAGRGDVGHHHRGDGLACGSLERGLPARVDRHDVEQGADDPVDAGEPFDACLGAGGIERGGQRVGTGRPRVVLAVGDAPSLVGGQRGRGRLGPLLLGGGASCRQPRCSLLGVGQLGAQPVGLGPEPLGLLLQRVEPLPDPLGLAATALDGRTKGRQLAPDLGGPAARQGHAVGPVGLEGLARGGQLGGGLGQLL